MKYSKQDFRKDVQNLVVIARNYSAREFIEKWENRVRFAKPKRPSESKEE